MANDDEYIFLSEDPALPLKIDESEYLRSFEKSLTPEEKTDAKTYIRLLTWPITNTQGRQNRNLAVMCFIEGVRHQKLKKNDLDPSYVQALFQVAIREISGWSGMKEDAIRRMLVQKIHEYVNENKTST